MGDGHHNAVETTTPQTWDPSLRQLAFDWNARDKYTGLKNFEIEVTNIFLMNTVT